MREEKDSSSKRDKRSCTQKIFAEICTVKLLDALHNTPKSTQAP